MRKSCLVVALTVWIASGILVVEPPADFGGHAFAAVPPKAFLLDVGDVRAASGRVPSGYGKLGLSREQKERIYGVQAAYVERIKALEAEIDQLKEEQLIRVKAVLNEPQRLQVEKYEIEVAAKKAK